MGKEACCMACIRFSVDRDRIGILCLATWRFAILYRSVRLDGRVVTLRNDPGPEKIPIEMIVEPQLGSVFSIWGISALNDGTELETSLSYWSIWSIDLGEEVSTGRLNRLACVMRR